MTKKEHMVNFTIEGEDMIQRIEQLEKEGYNINTLLKNYTDAIQYGWEEHIKQHPRLQAWYRIRCDLLQMIDNIDQKIDEYIEEIQEE